MQIYVHGSVEVITIVEERKVIVVRNNDDDDKIDNIIIGISFRHKKTPDKRVQKKILSENSYKIRALIRRRTNNCN